MGEDNTYLKTEVFIWQYDASFKILHVNHWNFVQTAHRARKSEI
jgi:hypothetical protein